MWACQQGQVLHAMQAPDALAWLRQACRMATSPPEHLPAALDLAAVAAEVFPPSEVNHYRHLRLFDFTDDAAALPPDEIRAALAPDGVAGAPPPDDAMMAQVEEQLNRFAAGVSSLARLTRSMRSMDGNLSFG